MGLGTRFKKNDKIEYTPEYIEPQPEKEIIFSEISQIQQNVHSVSSSDLEQYMHDSTVSKIVVIGECAKIYRDDKFSEMVSIYDGLGYFIKNSANVFQYSKDGFVISGVLPPVTEKICLIFEKINCYSPMDLVNKSILSPKVMDFLEKSVRARKNILIANDANSQILNTIAAYFLTNHEIILLRGLKKIGSQNYITAFNLGELDGKDFDNALNTALKSYSEYLISDIDDEIKIAKILSKTHELSGKIISIPAGNVQSALSQAIYMIMCEEHCNEKIAKSKLLKSFQYILCGNSIYIISPAKTAIVVLKEVLAVM